MKLRNYCCFLFLIGSQVCNNPATIGCNLQYKWKNVWEGYSFLGIFARMATLSGLTLSHSHWFWSTSANTSIWISFSSISDYLNTWLIAGAGSSSRVFKAGRNWNTATSLVKSPSRCSLRLSGEHELQWGKQQLWPYARERGTSSEAYNSRICW